MRMTFEIPLQPITKKNSQRILRNNATGRSFIAPSERYKQYEKDAAWFIPRVEKPIDYPVNIQYLFYMPTQRPVDLTNLTEAADDILVRCGLLADDNYKIVAGHDGSRVYCDKKRPHTLVVIESCDG